MTTEEKAKAYDEAIERAKNFENKFGGRDYPEYIFPELKENEDERIRTRLLGYFHGVKDSAGCPVFWEGLNIDNILTWLEKQKDKMVEFDHFKYEKHSLDLDNASQDYVYSHFCSGADFTPDYIKGLMEDAFVDGANWQKEQKPMEFTHHETNESLKDAVTHQMEDDGDVDDFVRRGIDEIALKYAELGARWQKEQQQEWSEEDDMLMDELESYILYDKEFNDEQKSWRIKRLKSLRPHWKPSEEQMEALNALNCHGDLSYVGQQNQLISLYNDLKKLM